MNGFLTTLILFLPMVGFTILLFLDEEEQKDAIKWTAFAFSMVTFALSLVMWAGFNNAEAGLQFVQRWTWLDIDVGAIAITSEYYVGVDGLSILLVVLTTFIMPIAILASFRAGVLEERGRHKLYYSLLLMLEWAMLGVFFIQDLIVFYVFWEITLVPMYFLIGIWGSEQRVYAAVKFFLYTMAGSILMLIAILFVGNYTGSFTLVGDGVDGNNAGIITQVQEFNRVNEENGYLADNSFWNYGSAEAAMIAAETGEVADDITDAGPLSAAVITGGLLFAAFFIAFAIKVPVFPFHSWLPDAHVQAPTAGSVILAGVLLKMGTYGLVRFNLQMFPVESVQWAPLIGTLAVIGILYGAWVSYAQDNVKKLVAYSSVSHLGFVVLGIFALNSQGIQGATLQMVNHGISTGGLFLIVGFLYERYHTKEMAAYGGIWKLMPLFGSLALVIALSSMGLPGLNGFIGEFTILLGSVGSEYLGFFWTLFGTIGVILAATYILKMYQHVFMGDAKEPEHVEEDTFKLHWTELSTLVVVVAVSIWIGIQPSGFFDNMGASSVALEAHVDQSYEAIEFNADLADEDVDTEGEIEDAGVADTDAEEDESEDVEAGTEDDADVEAGAASEGEETESESEESSGE
ncbi:MAG: NADH-quinone oxidoreductase subunit M [Chloroflexota bacterium]